MNTFPVVTQGNDILKYIFPTKQKDVLKIIEYSQENPNILKTIIFGSSVTWSCSVSSDIDIAVILEDHSDNEFGKVIHELTNRLNSEFDLINYNRLDNDILKNEIDSKGVIIYARNVKKSKGR